jgi:cytochrome c oxidase assembly protein subunit 15
MPSFLKSKTAFQKFNLLNLFYTLIVILWGAYVRASSSGAGCGAHWPLCNGEVIPTPDRIQTWVEFAHRATSGVSLILVVFGFLWALSVAAKGSLVRRAALLTVIAIFLEAAIGAGLVLLRLVEFDQSIARAISISMHLVNTLFLLASVVSLTVLSRNESSYVPSTKKVFPRDPLFLWTLLVFVCLGVTGAITALGDTLFTGDIPHEWDAGRFEDGRSFYYEIKGHPSYFSDGLGAPCFYLEQES